MIIEKIGEGDTIEQAREDARNKLNAPEYADIKFDIICAPSKKILGLFGGKKAQVKASYEKEEKPKKKQQANKAKAKKADKKPAKKNTEKEQKQEGKDVILTQFLLNNYCFSYEKSIKLLMIKFPTQKTQLLLTSNSPPKQTYCFLSLFIL